MLDRQGTLRRPGKPSFVLLTQIDYIKWKNKKGAQPAAIRAPYPVHGMGTAALAGATLSSSRRPRGGGGAAARFDRGQLQLVGCQYQVLMVGSVPSLPFVPLLTSR